jgi:broad specificity phosphatase PhoE
MARLYLVRHGEPTGNWGSSPDPDPGLTELGHQQAKATADRLRLLSPRQIVTSPLRRAAETAMPLAMSLSMQPHVVKEISEIPTPPSIIPQHRTEWLRAVMARNWSDVESSLQQWRESAVGFLTRLSADTAVFSHYVMINAALGSAIGDERVMCYSPAHASVTILETNGRLLSLVELGDTAQTAVR